MFHNLSVNLQFEWNIDVLGIIDLYMYKPGLNAINKQNQYGRKRRSSGN